jgi:hypothetical protein
MIGYFILISYDVNHHVRQLGENLEHQSMLSMPE